MLPPPPRSTLFPYTTLFRSDGVRGVMEARAWVGDRSNALKVYGRFETRDRKSTRLNSSHTVISYAVFCLKKKKQRNECEGTRNREKQRGSAQGAQRMKSTG